MAEPVVLDEPDLDPAVWRGRWMSAIALCAALILIVLLFLVTLSNRNRDEALELERNTYEVMHLARTIDASIARAEAAMGRYVLDEAPLTVTAYYGEWRLAGSQIAQLRDLVRRDPEQLRRVDQLRALFNRRGEELARAGLAAQRRQGQVGLQLFFAASRSGTLPALRAQIDALVRSGRATLQERITATEARASQADWYTQWLGWLAVLISLLAIFLSYSAYRAFTLGRLARSAAETEAWRAAALEQAVQERTRELSDANVRLQAEAAERAAAEAQLRQVQKMDAVGQLTGGIAHDFNNMLAVVVGGLDLAKRKLRASPRDVEMHLDNALEGATRAAALTRRLLAFARAEPLLPEAVAPATLIENMLELVDRTIGERIRVHTRFPEEEWRIYADLNGLENAVLNLCVNARDAMEETGDLTISVENVTLAEGEIGSLPAGEFVAIRVQDTGSGIAPEHLERVFEPFFTTKAVGKGTGLGLSQVFGFARQSGGDVGIASIEGAGTTVSIYLPKANIDMEAVRPADAGPARGEATAEAGATAASARILVVEDDPRVSRATVSALQEIGHRPTAVASGVEALVTLHDDPSFDLLITDVVMPGMTGIELAREVSARRPQLGILFVTGYVGEAGTYEELAGQDLLRKPFTVAQLAAAVEAKLGPMRGLPAAAE